MTNGGAKRRTLAALRNVCKRLGKHQWTGDKKVHCEVCQVKKDV